MVEVRHLFWIAAIASLGCNKQDGVDVDTEIDITDYLGMDEARAWTFRDDDASGTPPSTENLLRARLVDQEIFDIRRGGRWADGTSEVRFTYVIDSHFRFADWQVQDAGGDSSLPVGFASPVDGQSVVESSWFCATQTGALLATYYGIFDDIVQFDCEGSAGPEGVYTFARDIGLVHFEGSGIILDLVAPW